MEKLVKDKTSSSEFLSDSQTKRAQRSTDHLMRLIIFLYFVVTIGVIAIFQILDLSIFQLIRLFILMVGISFLIPIKTYRKRWKLSFYEYLLYNILFVGPSFLLLVFALNFTKTSPTYTESYTVISKVRNEGSVTLILENNKYQNKSYLRTFKNGKNFLNISKARKLELEFSKGLLGIRIIKNRKLQ